MKKIHILVESKALKPLYIIQQLYDETFWSNYEITVLTDDGRGCVIDYCKEHSIKTQLFDENTYTNLDTERADMLISVGWGKLIRSNVLDNYEYCLNCHGSYLPDYRGSRAYMASYANIADFYGATIHYMTEKFDDGNIIKQSKLKLYLDETPEIIHMRICELTALILPEAVQLAFDGYKGKKQTGQARYFFKMTTDEMNSIRRKNVASIRMGADIELAPHKIIEIQ